MSVTACFLFSHFICSFQTEKERFSFCDELFGWNDANYISSDGWTRATEDFRHRKEYRGTYALEIMLGFEMYSFSSASIVASFHEKYERLLTIS